MGCGQSRPPIEGRVATARGPYDEGGFLNRRLPLLATAVLAAIMALPAATATGQNPDGRTITLFEREDAGTFAFVDNAPKSRARGEEPDVSSGDEFVLTIPLFHRSKDRAGTLHGHCVATRARKSFARSTFLCRAVIKLGTGNLAIEGVFTGSEGPEESPFAITGGTGAYDGARGSFTSRDLRGGRTEDKIRLLP